MHEVSTDPAYTPMLMKIPPEELAGLMEPEVLLRSLKCLNTLDFGVLSKFAASALFDCSPASAFGNVDVVVLWGEMSIPMCLWTAGVMEDRFKEAETKGKHARKAKFVKIDGLANHLVSVTVF